MVFRLIYEIEDLTNGEIKDIIIPKCTNPFSEKRLSLDYKEGRLNLEDPHWFDELDNPVSPAKETWS